MLQVREVRTAEDASSEAGDVDLALREYALELGAELYGVASAGDYAEHFPDKPQPAAFVEGAQSVVVIGLPFEPGTVATVLRPELSGLRRKASDQVATSGTNPLGAERFFLGEENAMISRELTWMAYRMAKFLRHSGWKAGPYHFQAGRPIEAKASSGEAA